MIDFMELCSLNIMEVGYDYEEFDYVKECMELDYIIEEASKNVTKENIIKRFITALKNIWNTILKAIKEFIFGTEKKVDNNNAIMLPAEERLLLMDNGVEAKIGEDFTTEIEVTVPADTLEGSAKEVAFSAIVLNDDYSKFMEQINELAFIIDDPSKQDKASKIIDVLESELETITSEAPKTKKVQIKKETVNNINEIIKSCNKYINNVSSNISSDVKRGLNNVSSKAKASLSVVKNRFTKLINKFMNICKLGASGIMKLINKAQAKIINAGAKIKDGANKVADSINAKADAVVKNKMDEIAIVGSMTNGANYDQRFKDESSLRSWIDRKRSRIKSIRITDQGEKISNLSNMMHGCDKLETADISKVNVGPIDKVKNIFSGCEKLKKLYCKDEDINIIIKGNNFSNKVKITEVL